MRIALLSDIHGNLFALETVLKELSFERIEKIICLGDVAALGPQPREVIARLQELGCPTVMGNADAYLLSPLPLEGEETRLVRELFRWGTEQLAPADQEYLRTFSPTIEVKLDEKRAMLCYHGSPDSFDIGVTATTPLEDVERMFAGYNARVLVGGHTHIQMIRRYKEASIVNVGSVGLAGVSAGTDGLPHRRAVQLAEYGIIDASNGQLNIELRQIPLDIAPLLQIAQESSMPHLDWWTGLWKRE